MSQQQFEHEVMDELRMMEDARNEWLRDKVAQKEYQQYIDQLKSEVQDEMER